MRLMKIHTRPAELIFTLSALSSRGVYRTSPLMLGGEGGVIANNMKSSLVRKQENVMKQPRKQS